MNQVIRRAAAYTLRRAPEIRGRGRLASAINNWFPPQSSEATMWASMRLGYDILVDLRSGTELQAYFTGDYDTDSIRSVLRLVKPDSVILDVGANIGFWTVPLARTLGARGRLHAFEPVPSNFKRLVQNVSRNGLEQVITAHPIGLSDRRSVLRISLREDFDNGAETGNAAIVIDSEDNRFACADINVDTLDDVAPSLGLTRLDFIKVDIEGHEDRFLAGADASIRRYRPILYVEINDPYYERRSLSATRLFEEWMAANSYSAAVQTDAGWRLDTLAKRKTGIDDVFFLPSEQAAGAMKRLAS